MPVLVAIVCFFLSGVAGLIYEVCWIRKASLIFGSTTYALSTVLAVFFIGLALGSWFFGRLSPRLKKPLRIYAFLEIGAALFALASPWLFAQINELYGHVYRAYSGDLGPLFLVRFALVALALLPPTFLLGGTFPLFARQFVVNRRRISMPVGLLYAVNTSGAALGCALAGFRLIPTIGVASTLWIGAALSLIAGVIVAAIRLPAPVDPANEPHSKELSRQAVSAHDSNPARVMISVLFFATGFVALASQILWARYLALLVRTTVLTYTLTLSVVLVGIVLGSVLAAPLFDRAARWRSLTFGTLQALTGLCLLTVMLLPPAAWKSIDQGFTAYFILLLPPAILSGASFPLAVRMVVSDPAFAGAGVGRMTAINTMGGVAGSLAFGFWALPALGLQPSLLLASGAAIASGTAAWGFLRGTPRALAVALSIGAIGIWLAVPRILPTRIPVDFLGERGSVVDFKEGLAANVAVVQAEESLRLEIDRWWQGDERKGHQIMAAHIPMILHPAPHDVLVVGAGVGQTARRFLMYDIRHLDCVDLEPAVFEIVRDHFESSWMDDPRTRLIREDGRNYLSHTNRRYDVISLEAGQIFRPGVAAFYTAEFYSRAAQKLNPGGLLAQFVPLPFLTEEQFRGIVRTFREAFPEAVLWYNTSELLLVGSRDVPIEIQQARLAMLVTAPIAEDLQYSYWGGPADWLRKPEVFLGGFLLGPRGLSALASNAPVYRDDVPILEYATVDAVESEMRELSTVDALRRYLDPIATVIEAGGPDDLSAQAERIREANLGDLVAAAYIRTVGALRQRGDLPGMRIALAEALKHNPSNLEAQRLMGDVHVQLGLAGDAIADYTEALRIDESDVLTHRGLAIALHLTGRPQDAIPHYRAAYRGRPSDFEIMNGFGGALAQAGQLEEAAQMLEEALRLRPDFAQAKANLERVRQALAQRAGK